MRLRSLLFVPGDSERKFAKAQESGADALILDLEDSVAPGQKAQARAHVASLLDKAESRAWSMRSLPTRAACRRWSSWVIHYPSPRPPLPWVGSA